MNLISFKQHFINNKKYCSNQKTIKNNTVIQYNFKQRL